MGETPFCAIKEMQTRIFFFRDEAKRFNNHRAAVCVRLQRQNAQLIEIH